MAGFFNSLLFSRSFVLLVCLLTAAMFRVGAEQSKVPVIDAGLGKCSAEFTVSDPSGKPVYDAKIRVHIAYGFLRARKLDLEVGTNADGKARFVGLPEKTKEPLEFIASHGDLEGSAIDDPAQTCKAQHQIALQKQR